MVFGVIERPPPDIARLAVKDCRLRRWRLWFLALSNAPQPNGHHKPRGAYLSAAVTASKKEAPSDSRAERHRSKARGTQRNLVRYMSLIVFMKYMVDLEAWIQEFENVTHSI